MTNDQITAIRDMVGVPASTVASCNSLRSGVLRGRAYAGVMAALESKYLCDACGDVNVRWNESNRCGECAARFQTQTRRNPECQPVGSR